MSGRQCSVLVVGVLAIVTTTLFFKHDESKPATEQNTVLAAATAPAPVNLAMTKSYDLLFLNDYTVWGVVDCRPSTEEIWVIHRVATMFAIQSISAHRPSTRPAGSN